MVNRCDNLFTLRYGDMMVWYIMITDDMDRLTNLLMFDNHDRHLWGNDYRSYDDNFDHIANYRDSENHMQKVLKEKRWEEINDFISFFRSINMIYFKKHCQSNLMCFRYFWNKLKIPQIPKFLLSIVWVRWKNSPLLLWKNYGLWEMKSRLLIVKEQTNWWSLAMFLSMVLEIASSCENFPNWKKDPALFPGKYCKNFYTVFMSVHPFLPSLSELAASTVCLI